MTQVALFSLALYHVLHSRHRFAAVLAAMGLFETAYDCRNYGVLGIALPAALGVLALVLAYLRWPLKARSLVVLALAAFLVAEYYGASGVFAAGRSFAHGFYEGMKRPALERGA